MVQGNLYNEDEIDIYDRYIVAFYTSLLALTGNDIYPTGKLLFCISSTFIVAGALVNANIFGTIAVIAQTMNRKG